MLNINKLNKNVIFIGIGIISTIAIVVLVFGSNTFTRRKHIEEESKNSYDNDTAGQNATNKAADYLISEGIFVNVAILKGGKDPDEILKKSGEEYFSNIIKNYSGALQ